MSRRRFATAQATYNSFIQSANSFQQLSTSIPCPHDAVDEIKSALANHIDVWQSIIRLDEAARRKSLLIFLNALFGIALAICMLQSCWDGVKCEVKWYFHQWMIQAMLTMSTLVLLWQIVDRTIVDIDTAFVEKRRPVRTLRAPVVRVTYSGVLSLKPSHIRWNLWLQLFINFIHPFPSLYIHEKVGLIMFLRLYHVFRLIRDNSDIWKHRRNIQRSAQYPIAALSFNWWLSLKTTVFTYSLACSIGFFSVSTFVFGYCLYVFEREARPDLFTFWPAIWVTLQCISVDWASDIYNQYNPETMLGRITCLTTTIFGLILMSFLIGVIAQRVLPSQAEQIAVMHLLVEKEKQHEKDKAARLIQRVWRSHRCAEDLKEKLSKKNPKLYRSLSEEEEKSFMDDFVVKSKEFRESHRHRIELQKQVDDYTATLRKPTQVAPVQLPTSASTASIAALGIPIDSSGQQSSSDISVISSPLDVGQTSSPIIAIMNCESKLDKLVDDVNGMKTQLESLHDLMGTMLRLIDESKQQMIQEDEDKDHSLMEQGITFKL